MNRLRPSCANRTRLPVCRRNGSSMCEPSLMTAWHAGLCTARFKVKAAQCVLADCPTHWDCERFKGNKNETGQINIIRTELLSVEVRPLASSMCVSGCVRKCGMKRQSSNVGHSVTSLSAPREGGQTLSSPHRKMEVDPPPNP